MIRGILYARRNDVIKKLKYKRHLFRDYNPTTCSKTRKRSYRSSTQIPIWCNVKTNFKKVALRNVRKKISNLAIGRDRK